MANHRQRLLNGPLRAMTLLPSQAAGWAHNVGTVVHIILAAIAPLGCDKIGPMRDHHPENKVNSPSDPDYKPPFDEKPILNMRTGQPRREGETIY
jgi:hypothetical protein